MIDIYYNDNIIIIIYKVKLELKLKVELPNTHQNWIIKL